MADSTSPPTPYYTDEWVTLYHGAFEDLLPWLDTQIDLVVTDPPYGETSLEWDHWLIDWPQRIVQADSMWCFGSMRMFIDHVSEFGGWKMSQDIVWEKRNGTGFDTDRFKRVHEHAVHWYRGAWADVRHVVPRVPRLGPDKSGVRRGTTPHRHDAGERAYIDDGLRLMRSVLQAKSVRGADAINETQKPQGILETLIEYACPLGGTVLDVFAGSGSTGIAARNIGRRAVLIEKRESQCEKAAAWLSQGVLSFGEVTT